MWHVYVTLSQTFRFKNTVLPSTKLKKRISIVQDSMFQLIKQQIHHLELA